MPKYNFLILGVTFMVGVMLKCPFLTLTLKVVPNVAKCLNTMKFLKPWLQTVQWEPFKPKGGPKLAVQNSLRKKKNFV